LAIALLFCYDAIEGARVFEFLSTSVVACIIFAVCVYSRVIFLQEKPC